MAFVINNRRDVACYVSTIQKSIKIYPRCIGMITCRKFSSPTGRMTPGAFGGGGLQRHVGRFDHFQHLAQVLDVEGDQQPHAVDGGRHHRLVRAGLLGLGGDLHRAGFQFAGGFDVEARHVRAFAGEDLGLLAGFEQRRGGEDGAGLVGARDDLLVIGEGAVDQSARPPRTSFMRKTTCPRPLGMTIEMHLGAVAGHAGQLAQSAGRDDGGEGLRRRAGRGCPCAPTGGNRRRRPW